MWPDTPKGQDALRCSIAASLFALQCEVAGQ